MRTQGKRVLAGALALGLLATAFLGLALLYNTRTPAETDLSKSAPKTSPPAPLSAPVTLKVVTFNIFDLYLVSSHRQQRMEAIGRKLAALDPDVVALQEAWIAADRATLLRTLQEGNSRLIHSHYFESGAVGSGLLILSAFPIEECFFHRFTRNGKWYKPYHGDWWAGKGVALARLTLPQGSIDFYDTHTHATYGTHEYDLDREAQMNEIGAFIAVSATGSSPALLLGDVNCRPESAIYETLLRACHATRLMTIPSKIDHVFAVSSPRYAFHPVETVPVQAPNGEVPFSDHIGYSSTIRIELAPPTP